MLYVPGTYIVRSTLLYLYVLAFLWFQDHMSIAEPSSLLEPNLCNEEWPVVWVMTVSSVYLFCYVDIAFFNLLLTDYDLV